jgi:hypothetical protein
VRIDGREIGDGRVGALSKRLQMLYIRYLDASVSRRSRL